MRALLTPLVLLMLVVVASESLCSSSGRNESGGDGGSSGVSMKVQGSYVWGPVGWDGPLRS